MEETPKQVVNTVKECAGIMGIELDLLLRARAHPDCPRNPEGGFAPSGRIYITDSFRQWIAAHRDELEAVTDEDRDHWKLRKERAQALLAEMELEIANKRIVNKQDVVDLLERIAAAQVSLFNSRLRQELPSRWNLPPEKIAELDTVISEIFNVFSKGVSAWK